MKPQNEVKKFRHQNEGLLKKQTPNKTPEVGLLLGSLMRANPVKLHTNYIGLMLVTSVMRVSIIRDKKLLLLL